MEDTYTASELWWLKRQAERLGVDWGWLWLHKNGFAHRVPAEIREKIEGKEIIRGGDE